MNPWSSLEEVSSAILSACVLNGIVFDGKIKVAFLEGSHLLSDHANCSTLHSKEIVSMILQYPLKLHSYIEYMGFIWI